MWGEGMKKIKVGLKGVDYSYYNLGCEALAYSIINILKKESQKLNISLDYYFFFSIKKNDEIEKISKMFSIETENISVIETSSKNLKKIINTIENYKKCDFIIDMSGGDSFADIYGIWRMLKESFYKSVAIKNNIPIILGPQTYGPYNKKISRKMAKYILEHAEAVFSRDVQSADLVSKISNVKPIISTDVAMNLPYIKNKGIKGENIGLNISALMWYSTYGIKIKINYQKYIEDLIHYLKKETNYNIYLISHVNADFETENDYKLCTALSKKYKVNLAPKFSDPIEAKSFISGLDLLIGSRMHATIAAFSSGVPIISLAYSKKFEGLYKSLNYNYYIDAEKENNETALEKTIKMINNIEELKKSREKSFKNAIIKTKLFDEKIREILSNLYK